MIISLNIITKSRQISILWGMNNACCFLSGVRKIGSGFLSLVGVLVARKCVRANILDTYNKVYVWIFTFRSCLIITFRI